MPQVSYDILTLPERFVECKIIFAIGVQYLFTGHSAESTLVGTEYLRPFFVCTGSRTSHAHESYGMRGVEIGWAHGVSISPVGSPFDSGNARLVVSSRMSARQTKAA